MSYTLYRLQVRCKSKIENFTEGIGAERRVGTTHTFSIYIIYIVNSAAAEKYFSKYSLKIYIFVQYVREISPRSL